jgi:hypothetical protein
MKTKMPRKETKQNKIQQRPKLKTQTKISRKKEEPVQGPTDPVPDPTRRRKIAAKGAAPGKAEANKRKK